MNNVMDLLQTEIKTGSSAPVSRSYSYGDCPSVMASNASSSSTAVSNMDVRPGEYVMRTLFSEFAILANKKISQVLTAEPFDKPLSKCLQRGEDATFDQLLTAFGSVAEYCLPSILRTLFAWRERQLAASLEFLENRVAKTTVDVRGNDSQSKASAKATLEMTEKMEQVFLIEKRDLAVEFLFCLVLIEVLKQLPLHPGHEDLTSCVERLAFKHFKFRESAQADPNLSNMNIIADLYAEVVGVMIHSRFPSVKKRFLSELAELKARDSTPLLTHEIISLLMGMKFFRVKMVPIEDFEASFLFMHECAQYFLEVKDKDIKHALAGFLVEILVPVAAVVKNEVNVPCLKNFVELLWVPTLELCTKKKHMLALFPLVTCLLCVSQRAFFLQNWHYFLVMCLSHLKNRDPKMSRVALESLYRLLWAYMIRIKCESNTATATRLQSIVNSLFPKGSKTVVPRDTPLSIFVKIIQFIAQERLDFAMKEIVFDLLSVGRPYKTIMTPERMSIGLRAFLVVADSLQQKEGEPPMPRSVGVMPSGCTVRVKKTFLNKLLTDDDARNIGMSQYYPYVRKALNDILRALDRDFGRTFMLTTVQNTNKEPELTITGDRKPKIDLFRTCVAAIPRLMPDGMSNEDLVNLLSRLTVHMDEEMRGLAFQSLQNIVNDFKEWRADVVSGFTSFILTEISDSFPSLLDDSLRMLLQLLSSWRNSLFSNTPEAVVVKEYLTADKDTRSRTSEALHHVEALTLVMMCSPRYSCRRVAALIMKEVRPIITLVSIEPSVVDILDNSCATVIESCLAQTEKASLFSSVGHSIDFQTLVERCTTSSGTLATSHDNVSTVGTPSKCASQDLFKDEYEVNTWNALLMAFMNEVHKSCPTASSHAYTISVQRMTSIYSQLETSSAILSDRASGLLRGNSSLPKKNPGERNCALYLWRSYLMMSCRIAPTSYVMHPIQDRMFDASSSPDGTLIAEKPTDGLRISPPLPKLATQSPATLFHHAVPLVRSDTADIRSAAILGLSFVNDIALRDLMDELSPIIRETVDKKQENKTRKKRRDFLRSQVGRLLQLLASRGVFGSCSWMIDDSTGCLIQVLLEYLDGMRICLEADKDFNCTVFEMKQTFCDFVSQSIQSFPLELRSGLIPNDIRKGLFTLFTSWAGAFTKGLLQDQSGMNIIEEVTPGNFEFAALTAMSCVLTCGPIDPDMLPEDSRLFDWLELLLSSDDDGVCSLGNKTLILLLEFNPDIGPLLIQVTQTRNTPPKELFVRQPNLRSTSVSTGDKGSITDVNINNLPRVSSPQPPGVTRSKSVQSLKALEDELLSPEDEYSLSKFFWISVAMLETDYEDEFLLAVRLLDKLLQRLPLDREDSREEVEKIYYQLKWHHYPGLHAMLLKGCTSPHTYDPTICLLHRLTSLIEVPLVDPSETGLSFPLNVMALLPHMLSNYDDPSPLCISAAESFAKWATEKSPKLDNLATVMTLYSRKSFSKESFQWAKCVVKYLYDAYSHVFPRIFSFLVEVAEGGPSIICSHTVSVLFCILHYIDVTSPSPSMNDELGRLINKFMESSQYRDVLKLIKIVVSRSSSLAAPPSSLTTFNSMTFGNSYISSSASDCVSIASTASFSGNEFGGKRELPGRTMEFAFDVIQTPIVAEKFMRMTDTRRIIMTKEEQRELSASPKKTLSHHPSFNESSGGNWKRNCPSQGRTRERLVSLLISFGQRMGLPKSPSVIFSQTSEVMDKQSSVASSTEDVSAANNEISVESKKEEMGDEFALFKEFDFLEYELESEESEGQDNFNCGLSRRSLSTLDDGEDMYSCSPLLHEESRDISLGNGDEEVGQRRIREEGDDASSEDEMKRVSPFGSNLMTASTSSSLERQGSSAKETSSDSNRPSSQMSGSSTQSEEDSTTIPSQLNHTLHEDEGINQTSC